MRSIRGRPSACPCWIMAALVGVALAVSSCGIEDGTPLPPTPTLTPSPEPTPTALPPGPPGVILGAMLERSDDPQQAAATFQVLMGVSVPGGESIVFSWEDAFSGVRVHCLGHALVMQEQVETYQFQFFSVSCGEPDQNDPLMAFASEGIDQAGNPAEVIYGERRNPAVVAIRVYYDGGETVALIGAGAWQAFVPPGATGVRVVAYDGAGNVLVETVPE